MKTSKIPDYSKVQTKVIKYFYKEMGSDQAMSPYMSLQATPLG